MSETRIFGGSKAQSPRRPRVATLTFCCLIVSLESWLAAGGLGLEGTCGRPGQDGAASVQTSWTNATQPPRPKPSGCVHVSLVSNSRTSATLSMNFPGQYWRPWLPSPGDSWRLAQQVDFTTAPPGKPLKNL